MRTLTIKFPDFLFAEVERTAKARKITKSEIVRERVEAGATAASGETPGAIWKRITDMAGDCDTIPRDFSANKKKYLRQWGFGHGKKHTNR